ncbi:outer membrane vitamin B12 receptor BtuB [Vibrio mimicus]|uniref:TonB-dependent receptor domain-containing protein n=1 Tax=Vibrio mimicus TaxID=674 RepID=UPI0002BBCC6D|nr:TonB-dependent receptor [Vibrio mimicus]EMB49481.1 outer membrane cobalamin receptor protein [Vibrio mimicus CAIM 602]MBY7676466.1 TonB-dependent receptor [Vibrio mimicus]MBY7728326.1 TonB-dependent receptor [Vibrio mimicus]TXY32192.1 TonB-dependent receptor [Vibrio mimicus]SUP16647.1 outer membrane vitamin B12 receptor BtuB [Vibrio mimicus]
MQKSLLAIILASLLTPISYLHASEAQPQETVVVTANRFEQAESSVLTSISVVTKADIEKLNVTSALDILKTLPGVEVNSQGGKGQISSIFLRGTSSKHTLVLVDGVKINSATAGGASLGLIPAFAIEQIEVVRGPRAAIYGSDAIGGVIHIKTIPDSRETKHDANLGYGNDDHSSLAWRSTGQLNDSTQASFVFSDEKSDGYRVNEVAPSSDSHGFQSQTLFGALRHDINDAWYVQFNGYQLSSDVEYANQFSGVKNESNTDFYSVAGALNFHKDNYASQLMVSRSDNESWDGVETGTVAKTALFSSRNSVSWLNHWTVIPTLNLAAGIDYDQEHARQGGANSSNYSKTEKDNKAAYVTAQFSKDIITAEASIRYDDDSAFGDQTTWNLGFGVAPSEYVEFVASTGTGFKAPTFNDLYWPGSGNPDLKPETSKSSEVGIRSYLSFIQIEISAYRNEIEDMIDWAPTGPGGAWIPSNIDNAKIEGIEIEALFETGVIEHRVSAEWKDPRDTSDDSLLIRRARENFSWVSTYTADNFGLSAVANYVGDRKDSTGKTMDAYTVLDLSANYKLTEAITLGARVGNIFDKEYQTAHSSGGKYYLGEGRNWFATVNYRF